MHLAYAPSMEARMVVMVASCETMEETGKKSAEESESLYVGSSALSSGASYLIATSLSSSIIIESVDSISRDERDAPLT